MRIESSRKSLIGGLLCLAITGFVGADLAVGQTGSVDAFARIGPASRYESAIAQGRGHLQELMAQGAPGISIAVGVDQSIVWAEGFGYANVELEVPVTPLTKFRVGSVSKPMTVTALAILFERGEVDLDAPIQRYVKDFPVKQEGEITPRLLASHRSGIRHYRPDRSDWFVTDHYDNVLDALGIFANDPLLFTPDDRYSYSSHGFNLLSAVIQEASGVEFLTFMRENVWGPLNLRNTLADHSDYIIEHRASAYTRLPNGKLRNGPYVDNSYKWAGGGFLSTPTDLIHFGFGVFSGELLTDETLSLLTTPRSDADGSPGKRYYGLGWSSYPNIGEGWIGHGGGGVGGNTIFLVNREAGVVIGISCNLGGCFRDVPELGGTIGMLFVH